MLSIFLMVSYIAVVCFIGWKIYSFLADKMIARIQRSKWFRVLISLLIAIICATGGIIQLNDYYSGKETGKIWFTVPLALITSLLFLFCTFLAYKDKKWEDGVSMLKNLLNHRGDRK